MEFNINNAECIKEYQRLGETIYKDICTGQEVAVPWGIDTYFLGIIFFILIAFLICSFIWLFKNY